MSDEPGASAPPLLFEHDGELRQAILVTPPQRAGYVVRDGGVELVVPGEQARYRDGVDRLGVQPAEAARAVQLATTDGARRWELELAPVPRQTAHVVHHAHQDPGWADRPTILRGRMATYLDEALDEVARTRHFPEPARFRWNVEVAYLVEDHRRTRAAAQGERLLAAL